MSFKKTDVFVMFTDEALDLRTELGTQQMLLGNVGQVEEFPRSKICHDLISRVGLQQANSKQNIIFKVRARRSEYAFIGT